MDSQPLGTAEEIDGLRDAVALVIAIRAGNRPAARQILSLRRGADFAVIEALVGIIEAFGVDAAACRDLSFDELLRRVSLHLAMQPGTSKAARAGPGGVPDSIARFPRPAPGAISPPE
jgi:hypothetical protein